MRGARSNRLSDGSLARRALADRPVGAAPRLARSAGAARRRWIAGSLGARSAARLAARSCRGGRRACASRCSCALVAMPLLGGGWLWLRSSSLVSVEHVRDRAACDGAAGRRDRRGAAARGHAHEHARRQHRAALRAAVARFPSSARSRRQHELSPLRCASTVVEQPPVAALLVAGARTAVAADGVVLGPALVDGSLPTIGAPARCRARAARVRRRRRCSRRSRVLGRRAARRSRAPCARVYAGPQGLTVRDAQRPARLLRRRHAAARQVAVAARACSPTRARPGASYVDVRAARTPGGGLPGGRRRRRAGERRRSRGGAVGQHRIDGRRAGRGPRRAATPDERHDRRRRAERSTASERPDEATTRGEPGATTSATPEAGERRSARRAPSRAAARV